MDAETIKTIISIQFTDAGIVPGPMHLATAVDYYNRTQEIPTIDHIIAMVTQNNEAMSALIPNIINQFMPPLPPNFILGDENGQDDHDEPDDQDDPNRPNGPNGPNGQGGDGNDANDTPNMSDDDEPPETQEFNFIGAVPANPNINIIPLPQLGQNFHEIMNMAMASAMIANTNEMSDVIKVLPQAEIDKLTLVMVKKPGEMNEYKNCLNCYDQFLATELVRILPCGHPFHRSCIDDQLQTQSHLCPYCKHEAGTYVLNNI